MTYEALTLIIEHYNVTMNVSPVMYLTMIHIDSMITIAATLKIFTTVIGIMWWIISCPKYIISPAAECHEQSKCDKECSDQVEKCVSQHFHTQVAPT